MQTVFWYKNKFKKDICFCFSWRVLSRISIFFHALQIAYIRSDPISTCNTVRVLHPSPAPCLFHIWFKPHYGELGLTCKLYGGYQFKNKKPSDRVIGDRGYPGDKTIVSTIGRVAHNIIRARWITHLLFCSENTYGFPRRILYVRYATYRQEYGRIQRNEMFVFFLIASRRRTKSVT